MSGKHMVTSQGRAEPGGHTAVTRSPEHASPGREVREAPGENFSSFRILPGHLSLSSSAGQKNEE